MVHSSMRTIERVRETRATKSTWWLWRCLCLRVCCEIWEATKSGRVWVAKFSVKVIEWPQTWRRTLIYGAFQNYESDIEKWRMGEIWWDLLSGCQCKAQLHWKHHEFQARITKTLQESWRWISILKILKNDDILYTNFKHIQTNS